MNRPSRTALGCFVIGTALLSPAGLAYPQSSPDASSRTLVVAAYLPDYRLARLRADPDAVAALTDLVLFSVQPGADGTIRDARGLLSQQQRWATLHRQPRPSFRLWLCVGGGGHHRSDGFLAMASDSIRRERFVQGLVKILLRHGFVGAELDWEPMELAHDTGTFDLLVQDLRKGFDRHGLLLSAAVADAHLLSSHAISALDRITLMAYDGPRHASLEQASDKVSRALANAVPPEKIVLGIPLYARRPRADDTIPLRELATRGALTGSSQQDQAGGLLFGGIATTRAKIRLVVERGLSGVSFWELTQDAPGNRSLIRVARDAIPGVMGTAERR